MHIHHYEASFSVVLYCSVKTTLNLSPGTYQLSVTIVFKMTVIYWTNNCLDLPEYLKYCLQLLLTLWNVYDFRWWEGRWRWFHIDRTHTLWKIHVENILIGLPPTILNRFILFKRQCPYSYRVQSIASSSHSRLCWYKLQSLKSKLWNYFSLGTMYYLTNYLY